MTHLFVTQLLSTIYFQMNLNLYMKMGIDVLSYLSYFKGKDMRTYMKIVLMYSLVHHIARGEYISSK